MGDCIKFMHMADVHLGAMPDAGKPWGQDRDKEIWNTFEEALQDADENGTDYILIAGDLFHRQPLKQELLEVNYLFSKLKKARVILMAGNHDCITPDSAYLDMKWSENVFFLGDGQMECVDLGDVCVYGFSYHSVELPEYRYDQVMIRQPEKINILLGHGGDEKHCPYHPEVLQSLGFDYIAFGHIHKPSLNNDFAMAMAGSLEPVTGNETGEHGYIEGTIDKTTKECSFRLVPFAKRQYIEAEITTDIEDTEMSVRDKINNLILLHGKDNILKIRISGKKNESIHFDIDKLQSLGNVLIEDQTIWDYDFDRLYEENKDNLLGSYIEKLRAMPENEVTKRALFLGTKALLDAMTNS